MGVCITGFAFGLFCCFVYCVVAWLIITDVSLVALLVRSVVDV